jgi:hypothetical protein
VKILSVKVGGVLEPPPSVASPIAGVMYPTTIVGHTTQFFFPYQLLYHFINIPSLQLGNNTREIHTTQKLCSLNPFLFCYPFSHSLQLQFITDLSTIITIKHMHLKHANNQHEIQLNHSLYKTYNFFSFMQSSCTTITHENKSVHD